MTDNTPDDWRSILVLGGTGKTGRRVAERLQARGYEVRIGSRAGTPRFDWDNRATWAPVMHGAGTTYLPYPDTTTDDPTPKTRVLTELAIDHGITLLVLLTGRGEPEAQHAEALLLNTGIEVTVLRCAWFMQIFSEDYLADVIASGTVALPAEATQLDPFVDVDDIADVAVAALTEPEHAGQLYELTGPDLMSFPAAIAQIAAATGQQIDYTTVTAREYAANPAQYGAPAELAEYLAALFTEVLGNEAHLADGVHRVLGRPPRTFADYAAHTAATGAWAPRHPAAVVTP